MEHKEKRHKVEDRHIFSEELKIKIAKKSSDRCVWCGKPVFFGYGGTVDHYIPLKKGGTNDLVNLVLMHEECNKNKGSRVVPVNIGASYLNDEPAAELSQYFEDYVHKYDYISRGNLICCDMYEMFFLPSEMEAAINRARRKGKKLDLQPKRSKYILKRAYPEDADKVIAYYVKYLKKYELLHSEEAAAVNIQFWMRFGSIYFIEKNGDIVAMVTATVNRNGYVSFNVFAYYSTPLAHTMAKGMVTCLGDAIMEENDIVYLPISFNIIQPDELANRSAPCQELIAYAGSFLCKLGFLYRQDYLETMGPDAKPQVREAAIDKFAEFITRFKDIENEVYTYMYQNNLEEYSWMTEEILERAFFGEEYYEKHDLK